MERISSNVQLKQARTRGVALALFIAASSASAEPVGTQAGTTCKLGLNWDFTHANGNRTLAEIDQVGNRFSGTVQTATPVATGTLSNGRVLGRALHFRIRWSNGHTGIYSGYVQPNGAVAGNNYDAASPGVHQLWTLRQRVRC